MRKTSGSMIQKIRERKEFNIRLTADIKEVENLATRFNRTRRFFVEFRTDQKGYCLFNIFKKFSNGMAHLETFETSIGPKCVLWNVEEWIKANHVRLPK